MPQWDTTIAMADGSTVGRAGSRVAVATVACRVTGLVRVLVLTAALGFGSRLLDAYNLANTMPNMVYELVAGGAMASVVVPLLTRARLSEPDGGVRYTQRLLSLLTYVLGAVTLLTTMAAPYLVEVCGPGLDPQQRQLATVLARFFLPQILFYGLGAAVSCVLNIGGRFAAASWAPLVNNLVVIVVGAIYLGIGGSADLRALPTGQVLLLGLGTTAGVFLQLAAVVVALRRSGFRLRPRWDPRGIGIRRIGRLGCWAMLSAVAAQAMYLVACRTASTAGAGALSAFQYGYMVLQMPFAVVVLSLMSTLLPRLSRHAARRDLPLLVGGLSRGLRLTSVVAAPIAVAMVVLGQPIVTGLFDTGTGDAAALRRLGATVAAFGLVLLPVAGYTILLRGFFAVQDTRTPAVVSVLVSLVGVLGCLTAGRLVPGEYLLVALPGVYALAYGSGLLAAAVTLRRRLGRLDGRRILATQLRLGVAVGAAAAVTVLAATVLAPYGQHGWPGVHGVIAAACGLGAYLGVGRLVGLDELREVFATVRGALPIG